MTKDNEFRTSVAGLLVGVVLMVALAPSTLTAQDMDARWLPWLGCWEAVESEEEAPLLCVQPSTEGSGVEFVTWSQGEITATETILADGIQREAEREECQGLEKAEFSDDGHRVYLNSQYVCEGDIQRAASGILAMVNPMEWVDIKAVDGSPWVLRYRLARASKVQEAGMENVVASRAADVKAARIAASTRLTEGDIIETVGKVDGAAVEALIVERGDPFAVNADLLVRLNEAGVPDRVIDLVVAISYPNRFAVKTGPAPVEEYAEDDPNIPRRSMYMAGGYYDPWYWGYGYPYYGFSRYGLGYNYYSPYYYGGYGYGYSYSPIIVTTRTSRSSMVKGQGYTRGGSSAGGSRGYAQPRSGSSGGGAAASGGGSRSSGGSSAGRTAKPRGGGGSVSSSSGSSKVRTAKPRGGGGGFF